MKILQSKQCARAHAANEIAWKSSLNIRNFLVQSSVKIMNFNMEKKLNDVIETFQTLSRYVL